MASFFPLRASPSAFTKRFSTVSRSFKISSVLMISRSRSGSTEFSTWMMSGFSNTRSTTTIACVSRICVKNWLPSPSPLFAPFHESRDVIELHDRRDLFLRFAQLVQFFQSLIRHGNDAHVRIDRRERIVRDQNILLREQFKSVDFPTFGSPTMPISSFMVF